MKTHCLGILLATAFFAFDPSAHAGSLGLVQNGDFETGDLTNWTLTVSPSDASFDLVDTNAGNFVMSFGSYSPSTLSQTLATIPGQSYTFHFDLLVDTDTDTDPSAFFQASWNGNTVYTLGDLTSSGLWLSNEFVVTATGDTSEIQFTAQNPASAFELDNVSVVPEPATWAMALSGLGMLTVFRRMKRKASA